MGMRGCALLVFIRIMEAKILWPIKKVVARGRHRLRVFGVQASEFFRTLLLLLRVAQ
jgi:hypothetical protein